MRDPATGFGVSLSSGNGGRVLLFDSAGACAGTIEAPPGYLLSHLVALPDRLLVVGQGEAVVDDWPDWHFEIDVASRRLVRAGPAY